MTSWPSGRKFLAASLFIAVSVGIAELQAMPVSLFARIPRATFQTGESVEQLAIIPADTVISNWTEMAIVASPEQGDGKDH